MIKLANDVKVFGQ